MALHELAGDRISLELVTPTPEFAYRPLAVAEPFGLGEARRYDVVRIASDHRAAVHIAGIKSVDTAAPQGRDLGRPRASLRRAAGGGGRPRDDIDPRQRDGPGARLHRPLPHRAARPRRAACPQRRVCGAPGSFLAATPLRARPDDRCACRRAWPAQGAAVARDPRAGAARAVRRPRLAKRCASCSTNAGSSCTSRATPLASRRASCRSSRTTACPPTGW